VLNDDACVASFRTTASKAVSPQNVERRVEDLERHLRLNLLAQQPGGRVLGAGREPDRGLVLDVVAE